MLLDLSKANERRGANRHRVQLERLKDRIGSPVVLNVSRRGVAVQVPAKCRFARGERHRFRLAVGPGSVDLEGRVTWTRSTWDNLGDSNDPIYLQTAGFDLIESLTPDNSDHWQALRTMVQDLPVGIKITSSRLL